MMQENDIGDSPLYSTLLAIFREPGTNHISVNVVVSSDEQHPASYYIKDEQEDHADAN